MTQPTPGDFNADSAIDDLDLAMWTAGLGMTADATHWHGDANDDGQVDGNDLIAVEQNMGNTLADVQIPEPATALLLGGLAIVTLSLHRSKTT